MPYTPFQFTVQPRASETITATLRTNDSSGGVIRPYRDGTVESADTFTVTAPTTFTLTEGGVYNISMRVDGVERAGYNFTLTTPGANPVLIPRPLGSVEPRSINFLPGDADYLGWNYDPIAAVNSSTITGGTLYVCNLRVNPGTISSASFLEVTAAASLTTAFVALYDRSTLGLLASSASAATITEFQKTNTFITIPFTTPYVVTEPRFIEVAFYTNGGTAPTLARSTNSTITNAGLPASRSRFATANTGLTTALPSTRAALTASGVGFWVGLK